MPYSMKITTLLALFCFSISYAQNDFSANVGEIKEKNYLTTIDFESIKGKIIIDVKINNQIRKFILDTGAPTSISENLLAELNYKSVKDITVNDANSKESENEVLIIPEFSINGLTFLDTYALKIPNTLIFECFKVDGIIGSNSLRNSVVDFDFQNKKITITDNFKNLGYTNIKGHKLYFKDAQSSPILKVKMKLGYLIFNEELMFDSGDDSFYSISNNNYSHIMDMVAKKQFPKELQNIKEADLLGMVASSKGSFSISLNGNADDNFNHKFRIQEFLFDTTTFDNIISTTTYGSNSRVGSEILNYGKLTLDYKRRKYYFQPYDNKYKIDVNHKINSFYPTFENDKFIVGIVWDDAVKEKIKPGDEILKINSIDFTTLSDCEIMLMSFDDFKDSKMLTITLKDKETNEIKVVEVPK